MNMKFKASMMKEWTLLDDRIIVGKKEVLLSSIIRVKHDPLKNGKASFSQSNGVIQAFYGPGNFDFVTLAYPAKQNAEGMQAAAYIEANYGDATHRKQMKEIEEKGFRIRCNVCGKIFCYNVDDLKKNRSRARDAALSSVGGVASGLSGNYTTGALYKMSADNQMDKIVDYNKCPSCGSRDLTQIFDDDIAKMQAQQNAPAQAAPSSADELKKFKELLDSGIITQEEFDAKKKQLLGL